MKRSQVPSPVLAVVPLIVGTLLASPVSAILWQVEKITIK